MLIENTQTSEKYSIRNLSMADALTLRRNGVVFYDYTKLTAINTCPTWGVLRYGLHKTEFPMTGGGRQTALECGKACHDFFAALRMWTLLDMCHRDGIDDYEGFDIHGRKLFGVERWQSMCSITQDSDRINNAQMFALDALHTSGYYDDPDDIRRTMTNMESACLVYADRYFKSNLPVYVKDAHIGVEIPFVLEVIDETSGFTACYCGRIDGIHVNESHPIVVENKTAARMSDSWRMAFAISHQITGYTIAASAILEQEINEALVYGVQIPLPRDAFSGVSVELCTRTHDDRVRWCEWFFQGVTQYEGLITRPTMAPRYSHSCNRFFSACEFIPYCSLSRDEQMQALEDMRENPWSPLDHVSDTTAEVE